MENRFTAVFQKKRVNGGLPLLRSCQVQIRKENHLNTASMSFIFVLSFFSIAAIISLTSSFDCKPDSRNDLSRECSSNVTTPFSSANLNAAASIQGLTQLLS